MQSWPCDCVLAEVLRVAGLKPSSVFSSVVVSNDEMEVRSGVPEGDVRGKSVGPAMCLQSDQHWIHSLPYLLPAD
jgi:hypothetical protein